MMVRLFAILVALTAACGLSQASGQEAAAPSPAAQSAAEPSPAAPSKPATLAADPAALEFFEKHVRPVLASRCYECHSAKLDEPKGGLRADSLAALLAGGDTGPAIVPGKPGESLLIDAINYGDLYQMPPKSKLPAEEVAALTKWVEMGAPWPQEEVAASASAKGSGFDLAARKAEHWCWQPIARHDPPAVRNEAWAGQPMDRFILARLEASGLSPSPRADRTLIRRLYFDLLGLPPTPEEVEAFVSLRRFAARPRATRRSAARLAPLSASAGAGTGSTWCGMPNRGGTSSTTTFPTPLSIATTSSGR
jgi:mono/diheme cytochrome c family protein